MANAKRTPRAVAPVSAPVAPVTAPATPVLVKVLPATVRQGTARAAAYAALVSCCATGTATRKDCLQAVKEAEQAWHAEQGRTPKGVNPAGWLSLFCAEFE